MGRRKPKSRCVVCGAPLPWGRVLCSRCRLTDPRLPPVDGDDAHRPRPVAADRWGNRP